MNKGVTHRIFPVSRVRNSNILEYGLVTTRNHSDWLWDWKHYPSSDLERTRLHDLLPLHWLGDGTWVFSAYSLWKLIKTN